MRLEKKQIFFQALKKMQYYLDMKLIKTKPFPAVEITPTSGNVVKIAIIKPGKAVDIMKNRKNTPIKEI